MWCLVLVSYIQYNFFKISWRSFVWMMIWYYPEFELRKKTTTVAFFPTCQKETTVSLKQYCGKIWFGSDLQRKDRKPMLDSRHILRCPAAVGLVAGLQFDRQRGDRPSHGSVLVTHIWYSHSVIILSIILAKYFQHMIIQYNNGSQCINNILCIFSNNIMICYVCYRIRYIIINSH